MESGAEIDAATAPETGAGAGASAAEAVAAIVATTTATRAAKATAEDLAIAAAARGGGGAGTRVLGGVEAARNGWIWRVGEAVGYIEGKQSEILVEAG